MIKSSGGRANRAGEGPRGRVELIPAKRRALILEQLKREGAAAIQELADAVGASASTIRRDLDHLVKRGALERTHGGALLQRTEHATFEPEIAIAAEFARRQKEAIGAAIAADLHAGQSVIFDSSTTVLAVARAVAARRIALTVVTNSLAIALVLADNPSVHLVVPGGTLRPGSMTLVGRPGDEFLGTIHADLALLGTHAITGTTLTETSMEVAAMKRAMIAAARRVIVLADSSKFTTPSFCTICDAIDVDEIVTDDDVDPMLLAGLEASKVPVRIVPVSRSDAVSPGV